MTKHYGLRALLCRQRTTPANWHHTENGRRSASSDAPIIDIECRRNNLSLRAPQECEEYLPARVSENTLPGVSEHSHDVMGSHDDVYAKGHFLERARPELPHDRFQKGMSMRWKPVSLRAGTTFAGPAVGAEDRCRTSGAQAFSVSESTIHFIMLHVATPGQKSVQREHRI